MAPLTEDEENADEGDVVQKLTAKRTEAAASLRNALKGEDAGALRAALSSARRAGLCGEEPEPWCTAAFADALRRGRPRANRSRLRDAFFLRAAQRGSSFRAA